MIGTMPLTKQKNPVEMTEWEDGDVRYIHTSDEGQWIGVEDENLVIDLEEAI